MKNFKKILFLIGVLSIALACNIKSKKTTDSVSVKPLIGTKEFKKIFDGKTLKNWKGDSNYWRIENGNLVGEVTPETILKRNTFIIWEGDQPDNFELKLEYRISAKGNSGINYRSELIDKISFALRGYQADIDGQNNYTGQNYEEKKRTTLAYQGEKVTIENQIDRKTSDSLIANIKKNCWQSREVISSLGNLDTLKSIIKKNQWNKIHLIVKDNTFQHYVNEVLMSEVIDNDSINRSTSGYIGVQVHVGPPMKVEYRNIRLKYFE